LLIISSTPTTKTTEKSMNEKYYTEEEKMGLTEYRAEVMFYPFVKTKPSLQLRNYRELKRLFRESV
jgi:hypothetical protein